MDHHPDDPEWISYVPIDPPIGDPYFPDQIVPALGIPYPDFIGGPD